MWRIVCRLFDIIIIKKGKYFRKAENWGEALGVVYINLGILSHVLELSAQLYRSWPEDKEFKMCEFLLVEVKTINRSFKKKLRVIRVLLIFMGWIIEEKAVTYREKKQKEENIRNMDRDRMESYLGKYMF